MQKQSHGPTGPETLRVSYLKSLSIRVSCFTVTPRVDKKPNGLPPRATIPQIPRTPAVSKTIPDFYKWTKSLLDPLTKTFCLMVLFIIIIVDRDRSCKIYKFPNRINCEFCLNVSSK